MSRRRINKENVAYPYTRILFSYQQNSVLNKLPIGWTLETLNKVKKAGHKRSPSMQFHLYEISNASKFIGTESSLMASDSE